MVCLFHPSPSEIAVELIYKNQMLRLYENQTVQILF